MTALQRKAKQALKAFAASQGKTVVSIRHIYPRAYCVARERSWAVIACPPQDAEPQIKQLRKSMPESGLIVLHDFAPQQFPESLKTGDWCSVGYISTADGCGTHWAVMAVD